MSNPEINTQLVFDASESREAAVAIALDLIKATCLSGDSSSLSAEMSRLSDYTNTIQEVLKGN